ncbi:MAG: hypothetical protein ACHQWH_03910 [Nitrososphaerales archaeon]
MNQLTVLTTRPLSTKKGLKKIHAFIQRQQQQQDILFHEKDPSFAASSDASVTASSLLLDPSSQMQQMSRLKIADHILFQLQQIIKSGPIHCYSDHHSQ